MSLKAKIRNYAKKNGIAAQVVLQNYMFERFLVRLSRSEYRDKFVIKGGVLIAAIVGLDTRSTMDLDTTLRGLPFVDEKIRTVLEAIGNVGVDDGVEFRVMSIEPIRKDDRYGGYRIRVNAVYDTVSTPLSIDVSTGDVITPGAIQYEFSGLFNEAEHISLWGYNIETVLAEKVETVLRRGIFNTRLKDYYDIYVLAATQKYNRKVFKEAFTATAAYRRSLENVANRDAIVRQIADDNGLREMWVKYQSQFAYAKGIPYSDIIAALQSLLNLL